MGSTAVCFTQLSLSLLTGYAQLGLVEPEKRVNRLQTLTVYLQRWSDRASDTIVLGQSEIVSVWSAIVLVQSSISSV